MPYKDKEKRNEYSRQWSKDHSKQHGLLVAKNNLAQRDWWKEYKRQLACIKCGENHPACLDFHHRDPKEKDFSLFMANRLRYGKERILQEIEKCDVLCANCHRKVHANIVLEKKKQTSPGHE